MKSLVFILILCVVQNLDCKSFNFGSFFRSGSYVNNPTAVQDLKQLPEISNNSEERHESESLSINEIFDQETNMSSVSHSENLENVTSDSNKVAADTLIQENSTIIDDSNTYANVSETSLTSESSSFISTSSSENTLSLNTTLSEVNNATFSTEDSEEVILGTKQPSMFTTVTRTLYQKTVEWVGDTYTLSILVPVAAGVLFAVTIILVIATCRCVRKKCRRRKFRKRVLPDSIKKLKPEDQARLLGDCCDSSDEF